MIEARSWIGTPWVHMHRRKGYGCDCIGFVGEALRVAGSSEDFTWPETYKSTPKSAILHAYLVRHLVEVAKSDLRVGDVLWIAWRQRPIHVALVGDFEKHGGDGAPFSIIHALRDVGSVRETSLTDDWLNRTVSVWRPKEFL